MPSTIESNRPTWESSGPFSAPDAMMAAGSLIEREYGYGYSLAVAAKVGAVTVFEVAHFDGSRFNVAADKWGNAKVLPNGAPAREILSDMRKNATAA